MKTDCEIIDGLGGPAKVAELLGYDKHNGTQRVHNWTTRGIPPKVKLERPDLFLQAIRPDVFSAVDVNLSEVPDKQAA